MAESAVPPATDQQSTVRPIRIIVKQSVHREVTMVAATKPAAPRSLPELRAAFGISRAQMGRLFKVSARTIERWETSGKLPPRSSAHQRLAQLQEIAELGLIVYTPKGLVLFLQSRFPEWDGRSGLELIEGGEGERVFGALASDYEGVPS